jgi:hypothetical protein
MRGNISTGTANAERNARATWHRVRSGTRIVRDEASGHPLGEPDAIARHAASTRSLLGNTQDLSCGLWGVPVTS